MKSRPEETPGTARPAPRTWVLLATAVLLLGVLPAARAQVTTLNQSFEGTTAPGWVINGTGFMPVLTAAQGTDPVGSGWLQLTSNATNESTYAYDATPFASANATITAQFNYVSFNGTGADGMTFFLADASVVASQGFSAGAYGGSLGYAQKTLAGGGGADINGLAGGYLGIGVDEYGNYSNPTEGRIGGPGFISNAVAVRGPGSGLNGYNYLGGTGSLSTPLSYPGQTTRPSGTQAETIQMVLTSTNQLTVSIEFGSSGVFNTVFTANLSGYTRPTNLVMGFTAGTGSLTSTQEIQNVLLSAVSANIWTNTSADSNWNTANDWLGNPAQVPSVGSDVLLNNAKVGTAQTINVGTNQILRSLQIDSPFSYTLNNGSFEFNNEGITGTSGIIVTSTNGQAVQTVNSNLSADVGIVVENNTLSALNLTGTLATGGNTVNFNGSGVVNESGVVSGTGSIYQTGPGTTFLTAANTYSGGTTVTAGTLEANNNAALGTGTVTLSGGTLASTTSRTLSNALALEGNAALSGLTSGGTLTQTGGSYTLNLANVTQTGGVILTNNATARTLTTEVDSGTSTISGIISDGGTGSALTKTGSGTLALGAVDTYTGATTVNGGTLQLGVKNAISSSSAVALNNSTLSLNGYSDSIGNLSFNNGTIDFGSGAPNTNTLLFNNMTTGTGVLTIDGWTSGSTTLAAKTSGIASALLNDVYFAGIGSGAVESGTSTNVGNSEGTGYVITPNTTFVVWDGNEAARNTAWNYTRFGTSNWVGNGTPSQTAGSTQKLEFTGNLGTSGPTMDTNYSANALLFNSAAGAFTIGQAGYTLTLDGPVPSIIQQSTNAQLISGGTIAVPANTVVDVSGTGGLTISSALTGGGTSTLSKLSAGTLYLSGTNSGYTGSIAVDAGTLSVSNSATVLGGTGATTTVQSGGTLQVTNSAGLPSPTLANALTLTGTGAGGIGALDSEVGTGNTATLTGGITLGGATAFNSGTGTLDIKTGAITGSGDNLTMTGAGAVTIASAITTGSGSVTLDGTGTTTFSGANTYTGMTTLNSGILDLNTTKLNGGLTINGGTANDNASGQLGTGSTLAINSGVFNLGSYSETISNLSGIPGGTLGLGTGTLTVAGTGASTFGGSITGTGTLANTNTGELILTGASPSFSGAVNLSNGIIIAGASNATGTSAVTVSSSGNFEVQGGSTLGSSFALSTNGASTGNGAIENLSGNNTITGGTTLSAASTVQTDAGTLTFSGAVGLGANAFTVAGAGNTTINGAITGTNSITMKGTGTLGLGASNTGYTGSVAVTAGTLQANVANVLSKASSISVSSGATLGLNGTSQSLVGTLSDAGTLSFGTGGTLTLAPTSASASSLSGSITGSGTLVLGTGETLTLGANFSDPNLNITLAGGTLMLNGTTDTFGALSVTSTSILDFASPSVSVLSVSGVTLSGGVNLDVNHWSNMVDFFYSTASPGTEGSTPINQIVFNGFSGNLTHWTTYTDGPLGLHEITPAPEPAAYGALFVGLSVAGLLLLRRRTGAS